MINKKNGKVETDMLLANLTFMRYTKKNVKTLDTTSQKKPRMVCVQRVIKRRIIPFIMLDMQRDINFLILLVLRLI